MDFVLLRLDEVERALRAELAQTPEAAAIGDLDRLIDRAQAARYDQHASSMTGMRGRIRWYLEELPLYALVRDLGDLIERRKAMLDVHKVGDMDGVRVISPPEPAVDVWINEGGALCDEDG